MNKTFFKEEQSFSNIWLYVFVTIVFTIAIAPTAVALYSQLAEGIPYGEKPSSNQALIILLLVLLLMYALTLLLFNKMKLVTQITNSGVHYRYPPFISKFKTVAKDDIASYELRKYRPIKEYSGWGIKHGRFGKAYNVKGNMGLQLYLNDDKKLLFGTQRGDAMLRAMNKLMKDYQSG
jgi:hypothetical protein